MNLRNWFRLVAAVAGLAVSSCSTTPESLVRGNPGQSGAAGDEWHSTARADVEAAYALFAANHPGMKDPANTGFPRLLMRARDAALQATNRSAGREGYAQALGAFSAQLSDGHALVFSNEEANSSPADGQWPGFVAAWRGRMLIAHAGPGSPAPVGSEILGCDGIAVQDLVRRRLLIQGFRSREAGAWWARAHHAFLSPSAADNDRPRTCRFRTAAGERAASLSWVPAPAEISTLLTRSSDGERTAIGMSEPRPGIFLVGMSSFSPDAQGAAAYRALFDALKAQRTRLDAARAIVIDLRFNNGGSSMWSREAAKALWGEAVVEQRMRDYFRNAQIWWRASRDNIAHAQSMSASRIAEGMAAALKRGEDYFVEGNRPAEAAGEPPLESNFVTPVYVITPGRCASACLDALDTFKRFGNVRLIGAPTSADSTYMEVRVAELPSGKGRIVIPVKLWAGRPRRSGKIYKPDIEVRDLDWSTATFLDRIERDLAFRR